MRLLRLALVLGVAALLASPALAQPGRGGFGMFGGGGPAGLLRIEKVQKDIGLEKEKGDKIRESLTKLRQEDLKDEYDKQGFRSQASDEEKAAARKKTQAAEEKVLKENLSEKQLTRLHQIQRQTQGVDIFQSEDVQTALKLTDKQKDQIKEINTDLRKEIGELFQPGQKPSADSFTKMQSLRKDALASAVKVLDASQKAQLKELTGEPLELKPEDFFGARGGKPGGGKPDKPRTDF
jgi:Spy/CpxP family protein refolding chaperone